MNYSNFICIKSLIYLNVTTLSDPNSLTLMLTSLLVCKLNHTQNLTFHVLVNLYFTHCFVNTTFTQNYNIPITLTIPIDVTIQDLLIS